MSDEHKEVDYNFQSQAFDPCYMMSLSECLQLGGNNNIDYNSLGTTSFGLSPSSMEVFSPPLPPHQGKISTSTQKPSPDDGGGGGETPVTQNSSMSCSSSEGVGEEDSGKSNTNNMEDHHSQVVKAKEDKGDEKNG